MQSLGSSSDDIARVQSALEHGPVAILFSGPGCKHCATVKRELQPAALRGGTVFEASVSTNEDLALSYGVSSVPTMVLLSGGRVRNRVTSVRANDFNRALADLR